MTTFTHNNCTFTVTKLEYQTLEQQVKDRIPRQQRSASPGGLVVNCRFGPVDETGQLIDGTTDYYGDLKQLFKNYLFVGLLKLYQQCFEDNEPRGDQTVQALFTRFVSLTTK